MEFNWFVEIPYKILIQFSRNLNGRCEICECLKYTTKSLKFPLISQLSQIL